MSTEFRFTKPKVDALPPAEPGKRDEYRDSLQAGLWLRVSPTGTKTYAVLARKKGGGLERITIGTSDKITPELARTQAKKVIADLAVGVSHAAAAKARRGEATFEELLTDYLDATPMKPKSLHNFKGFYERHIKAEIGRRKLAEVTPDRVTAIHRKVSKETPTTANRCVSLIKAAFNWGIDNGRWAGANPAGRIKKNRETSRERYLLPAELARFFESLAECEEPAKSFFTMALLTGARKSNVLAMRWADVNLPDAVWTLRAADAKAGEQLNIPLVPEAVEILKRLKIEQEAIARFSKKDPPPWVFPAESKDGHYTEPKRAWATLLRRAEIADLRIHDLRRTMGSWLVRTGASTAINAKALGHKSIQAAAVYQRIADHDPVREAMERASAAMLGTKAVQP